MAAVSHSYVHQAGFSPNHARRQPYHKPHTALGATGHWVKTAGILAPLVIGEFVKDSEQRWRYIRIASVATALISEGLWTHKIHNERRAAQERDGECDRSA